MAKDTNDKSTQDAIPAASTSLYRVNYQYVSPTGQLRAGAMVIDTTSAEKAKKEAEETLSKTSFRHPKVTSIKTY